MNHIRHMGLFNAAQLPVTLIGSGGIGALTAVVLAKMGIPSITLFDGDVVGEENLATQFHRVFDVGNAKAISVGDQINQFSDETDTIIYPYRVNADTEPWAVANPIIISAVDSIGARKEIWEVVKQTKFLWYLDARMGAESFSLYTVNGKDRQWYSDVIAAQDESLVPELPCTAKATIYTAAFAAGHIGKTVRKIVSYMDVPKMTVHNIVEDNLFVI